MLQFTTVKDVKINIGQWCKLLRKEHNLSRKQLAEQLALSALTISKLENGHNPTLETLLKILQHFEQLDSFNVWIQTKTTEINTNSSLY
ncbi:helix-turn-helix domain-containing protein [Planobacterium oryzisoli]|uniref:Helix-turn-helix transcriptional regulator n=1 Tax=Planobacterium oryzisoli TaxID=2771435 RepID=A0A930YVW0_9FLAO|nr:helix-turn-helix transcriptional regulator [Planobacterium oryzisoli]MBF5027362.1 helix-turn-helix transcriptional regulator [Planobacterium oryzisoli]